jgi:hypothetical protein
MSNAGVLPAQRFLVAFRKGMRPLKFAHKRVSEFLSSQVNPILFLLGHAVVDESDSRRVLFCYDVTLPGLDEAMKQEQRVTVSSERFSALLAAGVGVLGDRDNAAAMLLAFKSRRFSFELPAPWWSLTLHYACVRQLFVGRAEFDRKKLSQLLHDWLNGQLKVEQDGEVIEAPTEFFSDSVERAIFGTFGPHDLNIVEPSVDVQYVSVGWTPPSEWEIIKQMRQKNALWQQKAEAAEVTKREAE